MKEVEILHKLLEASNHGCITTKKLDAILFDCWGNKYDAGMHCNSMMRRGLIDYEGEGDWQIFVTEDDLEVEEQL